MENIVYAVVSAVIGLGILIVVHEFGHFIVAKKTGVGVLTFSVGFGPKLLTRKVGETEYALSAFPLGGYVKMIGEDPEDEVQPEDIERSFSHQGVLKRFAIVAAGPTFNLLLAVFFFATIFMFYGVPLLTTRVSAVEPNSPAAKAGIQKGDRVIAVNGRAVGKWEELSAEIKESQGKALNLTLRRGDEQLSLTVQPTKREGRNMFGERTEHWLIGIASEVSMEKNDPLLAIRNAFTKTWDYCVLTLTALVKMVRGDVSPKNLGGPLMIAQMAGQQAQEGLGNYLFFLALLSVNLGVLNLLPIPVLDGGHLFFFLIESMIGRPVELKHRERAQQVGIFVLILIMVYAFYNDISRFFEG